MLPIWLAVLVVIFLVISLIPHRRGRHPHMQALLAVVVVLAYVSVHSHAI
jgi:hypothetical protein